MACVSFSKQVKPHYLGALLVILAPHQGSIILKERKKNSIRGYEKTFIIINSSNEYAALTLYAPIAVHFNTTFHKSWPF